jgi:hypothetical protein
LSTNFNLLRNIVFFPPNKDITYCPSFLWRRRLLFKLAIIPITIT